MYPNKQNMDYFENKSGPELYSNYLPIKICDTILTSVKIDILVATGLVILWYLICCMLLYNFFNIKCPH